MIIEELTNGKIPRPGSQQNRFSSEPKGNFTSLFGNADNKLNASVTKALELGDTIKRIRG